MTCADIWGTCQAALRPKGSVDRLLLVAAFAVSGFQSVVNMKCAVPCMGETCEARTLHSPLLLNVLFCEHPQRP